MKKRYLAILTAAGVLSAAAAAGAEETELQTEAATEMETETEEEAVRVHETVMTLEGETIVSIINETDSEMENVTLRKAFEEVWMEEADLETFAPEEDAVYELRLDTEDGDALLYAGISFDNCTEIRLYEKEDAVYVIYVDAEGEEISMEEYPVVMLEEAVTKWTLSNLNVRALPSTEGEKLAVLEVASEAEVYGELEGWCLIRYEDGYAYVSSDYLTEDQELAEQKAEEMREAARLAAEEAARIAAAEEAARIAAQQAQQSQQTPATEAPVTEAPATEAPATEAPVDEIYEVSRENIPGCDDPDHGVTIITYSDGSQSVISY